MTSPTARRGRPDGTASGLITSSSSFDRWNIFASPNAVSDRSFVSTFANKLNIYGRQSERERERAIMTIDPERNDPSATGGA